jgi:hypothetical protein
MSPFSSPRVRMGEVVSSPRIRPTVDQINGSDTLNGNRVLFLPKKCDLQEAGAGADVAAGGRRSLAIGEAALTENSWRGTASKHYNDKKKAIGVPLEFMCKAWVFITNNFGRGFIHLATTMLRDTLLQILSVFFVILSWTDIKYALGQTDYGCNMAVDPVAGKTWSNSFMVAMTLLAIIIVGPVGVAFRIHFRRRRSMDFIDEALKAGPPRMLRDDPDMVLPPPMEPWSGME